MFTALRFSLSLADRENRTFWRLASRRYARSVFQLLIFSLRVYEVQKSKHKCRERFVARIERCVCSQLKKKNITRLEWRYFLNGQQTVCFIESGLHQMSVKWRTELKKRTSCSKNIKYVVTCWLDRWSQTLEWLTMIALISDGRSAWLGCMTVQKWLVAWMEVPWDFAAVRCCDTAPRTHLHMYTYVHWKSHRVKRLTVSCVGIS